MSATAILSETAHRTWPLPRGPWIMRQSWHELLFAHWPLDPALLAARIPPGLALDTFDGRAYLGVIPFRMSGVAPRAVPAMPWLSAFAELNVRTYVMRDGIPGVWFFSLDAANPLAVALARALFFLPYYSARMRCVRDGGAIRYASRRSQRVARPAAFAATYRPTGPVYHAAPGTLDHWLTERYCLYAASPRGALYRCDIHHAPWPLQPAAATITENSMASAAAGLTLPDTAPHLRYAARQDVLVWTPRRLG